MFVCLSAHILGATCPNFSTGFQYIAMMLSFSGSIAITGTLYSSGFNDDVMQIAVIAEKCDKRLCYGRGTARCASQ